MKQKLSCILICFLICFYATAQVKPNAVQNPSLSKTTINNNQSASQGKSNAASQTGNVMINLNTLTPANQKVDGVAEFTYKGGDYNETSKKLFIHGCANLSVLPCIPGPCVCNAGVTIKVSDITHTQFKVDAIVSFDKNYYKDDPFVDVSKIPAGNNYFYSAIGPDAYRDPISGTNKKTLIASSTPTGAVGVQKLTLLIKQKADGTPFTTADYRNIEVYLTADYAFELRSVTVTPL